MPDAAARPATSDLDPAEVVDPGRLERVAAEAATAAADLARQRLGHARLIETKASPTDAVTDVDIEIEAFVRSRLSSATPGAAIVGEERDPVAGETSIGWVIDPIDGTVNLLYDLPVMSVSIAATLNDEVVAGAVADVVRGEVFSGSVGGGVRRDGVLVGPSEVSRLGAALVGTGFSYRSAVRRREGVVVARLLPEVRDIRCFGSAALHLCWVACGRLEAFYQAGLRVWDVAAGGFLAAEAGASVEYGSSDNGDLMLAAAPGIFDELRGVILTGEST